MAIVKTFNEFINESVWTDIHKRSNGTQTRKEDDIEHLDKVGLYDYILAHYELTDKKREMTYGSKNLSIDLTSSGEDMLLIYDFNEARLFFNIYKYGDLWRALDDKFEVTQIHYEHFRIDPKGECTNQFYLDLLDCIIENRKDIILRKKSDQ